MSTITLGADLDFGAKTLSGKTYEYITASGGNAASWGTVGSTTLSTSLKEAVAEVCTAVDGKMTGTPTSGNIADGGTGIPNEDQVHSFVTSQNYLTAHQSLSAYAKKSDLTQDITANSVSADTEMTLPSLEPYNTSTGLTIGETGSSKCYIEVVNTTVKVIGKDSSGNATTLITFTAG